MLDMSDASDKMSGRSLDDMSDKTQQICQNLCHRGCHLKKVFSIGVTKAEYHMLDINNKNNSH